MKKIVKFVGSVLLGVKDSTPILATIKNVVKKEDVKTNHGETVEKTRVDYIRLLTTVCIVLLIIGFVTGKITIEQLKAILPFFVK